MRTIETTVTVASDGTATLKLPPDVLPGEHRGILILAEQSALEAIDSLGERTAYPVGLAKDTTFRREELYDRRGS